MNYKSDEEIESILIGILERAVSDIKTSKHCDAARIFDDARARALIVINGYMRERDRNERD